MYIMCVTLCLFSTLSCRVGASQISIIIIIIIVVVVVVVVVNDCMLQWPSAKDV